MTPIQQKATKSSALAIFPILHVSSLLHNVACTNEFENIIYFNIQCIEYAKST